MVNSVISALYTAKRLIKACNGVGMQLVGASTIVKVLYDKCQEWRGLVGGPSSGSDNEKDKLCTEKDFPLWLAINGFQNKTVMIGGRNVSCKEWPGGGYYKDSRDNKLHEFDGSEIKMGSLVFKITFPNFDVNKPDRPNGFEIIDLKLYVERKNPKNATEPELKETDIKVQYKYSRVRQTFDPMKITHVHVYEKRNDL